jgi:hypothetical protein
MCADITQPFDELLRLIDQVQRDVEHGGVDPQEYINCSRELSDRVNKLHCRITALENTAHAAVKRDSMLRKLHDTFVSTLRLS